MAIFKTAEVNQRNAQNRKGSLSAQDRTVLSRMKAEQTVPDELEDTTTQSQRAADENIGFGGRIDRFFSRSVEIHFNGTTIKGKNGYQVRGGVVPLFPGAVLDLTPAFLRGRIDWEKNQYADMEAGGKPKVMLSPVGTNFLTEHEVDDMVLGRTSRQKDAVWFNAVVDKPVEYQHGSGTKVRGIGLIVRRNSVSILDPSIEKSGQEGPRDLEEAAINERGLEIREQPQAAADTTPTTGNAAATTDTPTGAATETPTPTDSTDTPQSQEEEQPKGILEQIRTADMDQEGENHTVKLNVKDGTFKFHFGKDFLDSEDEEEEDDEEEEETPRSLKGKIKKYYDDFKDEARDLWDKLKFAKGAFEQYCETGKLPENKFETDKEDDEGGASLDAKFMLIPGVYFNVELAPVYSFGVGGGVELRNANEQEGGNGLEGEYRVENGQIVDVTYPDIEKIFSVTVGLRGKLGATLSLTLSAGIGYIFEVAGGVWANGTVEGNLPEGTFAQTTVELGISKRKNEHTKLSSPLRAILKAGVDLKGSVGMAIKTASKLFDWEKELFNYTFKEWKLGDLRADLTLVKNDPLSSFTSIGSWRREQSSLEINAFGHQIANRKKDKYGLRVEENDRLETITENTAHRVKKMEAICTRIREIRQKIGEDNVIVAAEGGSEAYNRLMEELRQSQEQLLTMVEAAKMDGERIDKKITDFLASDQWIKNNAMANEGIKEHVERVQTMEKWNEDFHGQDETERDNAALSRYQELYKGKGADRAKSREDHEKAVQKVATKANLILYETGRLQEYQKKHQTRLDTLRKYLADNNITNLDAPNPGFLGFYKELGGKQMLSQMGKFGSREGLLQYERGRRDAVTKKHTDRIALLRAKQRELNIGEDKLNQPNPAFARFYQEELKGKMMYKHLIDNHADMDGLLAYEKNSLMSRAGDHMRYIDALKDFKKKVSEAPEEEERGRLEKEAIKWYKIETGIGAEGKLEFLTSEKKAARTAAKHDILMYEKQRLLEYQAAKQGMRKPNIAKRIAHRDRLKQQIAAGQGMDYAAKVLKSTALSNNKDKFTQADGTRAEVDLSYIKNKYKDWSGWERSDEVIKSMLSLDMMLRYENERFQAVKSQKKKAKHQERIDWLAARIKEISAIRDPEERELEIEKVKEAYYTGGETEEGEGILTAFKKGKLKEPELMLQSMQDSVDGVDNVHKERLRQLRNFMGIPQPAEEGQAMAVEDTSASVRSDAEVWQFYKSIGGGSRFREVWGGARIKNDTASIDDLIRYETVEARKASRQSAAARGVKQLKAEKGEAREALRDALMGGHFDRYQMLLSLKEQGKSDDEIVEAYKNMGGGKKFEKNLQANMFFMVTPTEIFKYERERASELGAKHDARMGMIEGEWKDLSFEQLEKNYREMASEDGTGKKDRFNSLAHNWHMKKTVGYDSAVDPEKVITPKLILEYEEKRNKELTQGHSERLAMLNSPEVDDTNVWEKYKEAGGGKRFQRNQNKSITKAQKDFEQDSWGYDQIMAYERGRVAHYQAVLAKAKEPLQNLRDARAKLEASRQECEALYKETQTFTATEGLKKLLGKAGGFQAFADRIKEADMPGKFKKAGVAAEQTAQSGAESEAAVAAVNELVVEQALEQERLEEEGA